MESHELERLSQRLSALESANRRLGRAVSVLLVVLGCAVWMGQAAPKAPRKKAAEPAAAAKVIEAQQFVLKSASGQVLASLGMTDGGPALRLLGPNGAARAVVGLDAGGLARVVLTRADNTPAAALALDKDGAPTLDLTGPDATNVRLVLGGQAPGVNLIDATGAVRLGLALSAEGPTLTLAGSDKVPRLSLTTIERGPQITLFDAQGRQRMMFGVRPDQAAIGLYDVKGDVRAGLEVRADNPAFALYGPNGKPLFVK
jgi:hypothetical protein